MFRCFDEVKYTSLTSFVVGVVLAWRGCLLACLEACCCFCFVARIIVLLQQARNGAVSCAPGHPYHTQKSRTKNLLFQYKCSSQSELDLNPLHIPSKTQRSSCQVIKVTVYLQGCPACKRCSECSLSVRQLNPFNKLKAYRAGYQTIQKILK